MGRIGEIGFSQVGVVEAAVGEIGAGAIGLCQIGFGEVHIFRQTANKLRFSSASGR